MKKVIVISIIVLFVGMSFTSISGNQVNENIFITSYKGNTLYVGGTGEGNYTKIQDAVDNASDGDTVFVYDDSSPYFERVFINTSINLIGEDRNTTVIEDNGIEIGEDRVNISGFTFKDRGIAGYGGFGFDLENVVISDNHFIGCGIGIILYSGYDISIILNTFNNCDIPIMLFSGNVRISNNVFTYSMSDWALEGDIYCDYGRKHVITNNIFINYNTGISRVGINLNGASDCFIEGNYFNGYENAFRLSYSANNNIISFNSIINNKLGIFVKSSSSSNIIKNNNFIDNKRQVSSRFLSFNSYDSNYWDNWIGLKIPSLDFLPYFSFSFLSSVIDRNPAKEPYEIPTTHGCGII